MADLKFDHAGMPEPPPLPVASNSNVEPKGSAGLVNQGTTETVGEVAPVYGRLAESSESAALSKRESDWRSLMGGHAGSSGGGMSEGY